ncbi:GTP cyclohydrolase N terminal-domain-containing protein [Limtongia smithiae]|uniref:GTP cyclohydrolase N terminal-domain-containing protein n=1 Tax=Limtongia smithiae TaxID=1125753 RepID=UPI0034CDB48D
MSTASALPVSTESLDSVLAQILLSVQSLQNDYKSLSEKIDSSNTSTVTSIQFLKQKLDIVEKHASLADRDTSALIPTPESVASGTLTEEPSPPISPALLSESQDIIVVSEGKHKHYNNASDKSTRHLSLTSYPGQLGIDPIKLQWGAANPAVRGPIVVTHSQPTFGKRNAMGAHSGPYSIYHALAIAIDELNVDHKPDFTNAQPPVSIGPYPQWGDPDKIVSMDPFGHLAPWLFEDYTKDGIEIRPTIAVTKAHMRLADIENEVRKGNLKVDGKVVLNEQGDLAVTKVAVEPVWYLPGVAKRFGIDEMRLRRSLFEDTGGSYPELITRPDIKVFLPPIGGLTAYIFGDPAKTADPNCRLALRVHDECNGSDVFGSDICTCRPYLIFGIVEAAKEAQNGGSGVVVYFRKEGRALGEVTKYLVYNARKRMGDSAAEYFKRTENIAGVKDMRFQALMPDILHFLGITKIDRMLSMSNMKHDAIISQGIPILERVPIPEDLIPEDSRVEIDAKIHAGYFTDGKVPTLADLQTVKGRQWDDVTY